MTFSITTLSIRSSYVTLGISDSQHKRPLALPLCWVSHFIFYYAECHYAERRYAECCSAISVSKLSPTKYFWGEDEKNGKESSLIISSFTPGNPYWRGRFSTVDLLMPTCLYHTLFIFLTLFTFFRTSYLNEEVSRTDPSPKVKIPWGQCYKTFSIRNLRIFVIS